jgi:hypothetical protein
VPVTEGRRPAGGGHGTGGCRRWDCGPVRKAHRTLGRTCGNYRGRPGPAILRGERAGPRPPDAIISVGGLSRPCCDTKALTVTSSTSSGQASLPPRSGVASKRAKRSQSSSGTRGKVNRDEEIWQGDRRTRCAATRAAAPRAVAARAHPVSRALQHEAFLASGHGIDHRQDDRLAELSAQGVAAWPDDLSRELPAGGELGSFVAGRHVIGITTNPTIYASACPQVTLQFPATRPPMTAR